MVIPLNVCKSCCCYGVWGRKDRWKARSREKKHLFSSQGIGRSGKEVDAGLHNLDPKLHTLGYIFLLQARCGFPMDEGLEFMQKCQLLFSQASFEQARMELKRFGRIVHKFTQVATELQVPMRAILPLEKAVRIAQEDDNQLTSVHADLLQCCLLSHSYRRARKILQESFLCVGDIRKNGFSQSDYLRFWYYAGLVFTGLKEFGRAIDCYETCFSAPAIALSAPALEAYKKHMLVSLIHRGAFDPKRSAPALMMRNMKSMSGPYNEFATAFTTKDMPALQIIATENSELFMKDKNWGLVHQCMESLGDRQIRALTQTYLTLNLETLAKDANLSGTEEAQKRLLAMIEGGTIVASINEKDGMVSFGESSDQYDDTKTLTNIDGRVKHAIHLGNLLRQLDDNIASSAEFIQKTQLAAEGRGFGGGAGGDEAFMMQGMMGMGGFEGNFNN